MALDSGFTASVVCKQTSTNLNKAPPSPPALLFATCSYDPDGQPANAILQRALLAYVNNCAGAPAATASACISAITPTAIRAAAPATAQSPAKLLRDMTTAYLSLEKRRRRLAAAGGDADSDSGDEDSAAGSSSKSSDCGSSVGAAKQREAAAYGLNLAPPVRVWQELGNGVE